MHKLLGLILEYIYQYKAFEIPAHISTLLPCAHYDVSLSEMRGAANEVEECWSVLQSTQ